MAGVCNGMFLWAGWVDGWLVARVVNGNREGKSKGSGERDLFGGGEAGVVLVSDGGVRDMRQRLVGGRCLVWSVPGLAVLFCLVMIEMTMKPRFLDWVFFLVASFLPCCF